MTKKLSKEIKEWMIFLAVTGILWMTGWWKDLGGFMQGIILKTGINRPSIIATPRSANYDFQIVNAKGQTINFSEFKGKTVFINIWATWCMPCIAEMPDIHDLYQKIGREVNFIMISVDQYADTALDFVKEKDYQFPVYFLKSGMPKEYETNNIPTTFVISPKGEIVVEEKGLSQYNTYEFINFLNDLTAGDPTSR